MLKIKIIILSMLIGQVVTAQYSFEVNYTGIDNEFLRYTFETTTGDFISIGGKKGASSPIPLSNLILKINKYGEITNELVYIKTDTNFVLKYGYEKANGNYFFMGTLTDSLTPNHYNTTYVCERTPELNLVWEKFYAIPEPYIHHNIDNFIMDADSILIIEGSADSSLQGYNNNLLTIKYDKYGNQLCLNFYEDGSWRNLHSSNEMIFNSDSTAIYFFGTHTTGVSVYKEFIEMDLDLNITDYITFIVWGHINPPPVTVKVLPNHNYFQANQAVMEPAYHDLYIKIMDEEFNTIRDTILLYPGYVHIPDYKGMGFNDPDQIWVPTYDPEFNFFSGTEVFRFHIFDSNLNLTGMKVYGGDRRYTFFNMIVTSDGGCLMTGSVADYEGSSNDNGYIIKVMPEDIITHAEETSITNDRDVSVYPNPFVNEIRFQTVRKNLVFELYDVMGKAIVSGDIDDNTESEISTVGLNHGIYFYTIRDNSRIIQSGKLIKE